MEVKVVFVVLFGGNLLILALLAAYNKKNSDAAIHYHLNAMIMMTLTYPFAWAKLLSSLRIFAILNASSMMAGIFFEALALSSLADILTPRMRKHLVTVLLFGLASFIAFVIAFDRIYIRVIILSFITLALVLYPSIRVLQAKGGSALRSLLGILLLFMVAATIIRMIDAIRLGTALVFFGPSLGEIVTIISFYVYMILGGVGIILLAKEKTDARLFRLANYDGSTGTLNRDGFITAVERSVEQCSYDNTSFSMLLIDIDGLDEINDINGFAAGDKIIAHAAERLLAGVRQSSGGGSGSGSGSTGFVGRLSGEEFMVFLKTVDSRRLEEEMARLQASVVGDFPDGLAFTVSIGGTAFDNPAGRAIGFSQIYADCRGALRGAKVKGHGQRFVALA